MMFAIVGLPASPVIAPMTVIKLWLCPGRRRPGNFASSCCRRLPGPVQGHSSFPAPPTPPAHHTLPYRHVWHDMSWGCGCASAAVRVPSLCCTCDGGPPSADSGVRRRGLWAVALIDSPRPGGQVGGIAVHGRTLLQAPDDPHRDRGCAWPAGDCRSCFWRRSIRSSGRSRGWYECGPGCLNQGALVWFLPGRCPGLA